MYLQLGLDFDGLLIADKSKACLFVSAELDDDTARLIEVTAALEWQYIESQLPRLRGELVGLFDRRSTTLVATWQRRVDADGRARLVQQAVLNKEVFKNYSRHLCVDRR